MTKVLSLSIMRTADGNDLPLPSYHSPYHMGLNLQAAIPSALRLEPGDRALVPVGFAVGVPEGYCGFVVSTFDMAQKEGLVVLDAPQLVHPADRGPLAVLMQNTSSHLVVLHRGDRIAQLVVMPAVQVAWKDFSDGQERGAVTDEQKVILENAGLHEKIQEEGQDKMFSFRRPQKSIRHRFSEEVKHEDF